VTYAATYQTLTSNECDVCDVSFQLQSQVEKNDDEISLANPIAAENEISGSDASQCITIESGTGFQPPQPCVTQTSHTSLLPEAQQNKGFDPLPHPSPLLTPDDELKIWEACCQTKPYPNPKSDNVRSSQKRALAIRQAYRAARTKEDLSALHRENGGEFSQDELTWVYNWLKIFFKAERNHVEMTAKISQLRLL
jgi:hypothetical protein